MTKKSKAILRLRQFLSFHWVDILLLTGCSAGLIFLLHPLLTGNMLTGWDLIPHYHLLNQMTNLLQEWKLRGNDLTWNAGCPVFYFYGPLVYALPAGLSLIDGVSIGPPFFFNVLLFFQPFLTVLLIFGLARKYGGPVCARFSIASSIYFLTTAINLSNAGTGIAGLIYHGLVNQLAGLNLLLAWLWVVAPDSPDRMRVHHIVAAALLLTAIVGTHMLTALFMFFAAVIFLVTSPHRAKSLAISMLLGLLLSGWFLFPYFSMKDLTGGNPISFVDPRYPDALMYLLPGLTPQAIMAVLHTPSWDTIANLPLTAIIIIISVPVGIFHCYEKRQRALPSLYLAGLIVLPRAFLTQILDTPLHSYRFIPPLFLLQMLLASIGLMQIWRCLRHTTIQRILKYSLLVLTIAAAITGMAGVFAWLQPRSPKALSDQISNSNRETYHLSITNYPYFLEAEALVNDLVSQYHGGRVCIEINSDDMARLGSPHFFDTILPLHYSIPVLPGLLAESSLAHGFVQAAMFPHSHMLSWAHSDLLKQPRFMSQNMESMLHRLGLFNIRYILTSSEEAAVNLTLVNQPPSTNTTITNPPPSISTILLSHHGPYRLFQIDPVRNPIEAIDYRPFLYVEQGGKNFRFFAEQWYQCVSLFDRPVIFTPKDYEKLTASEQKNIGGLILSYPSGTQICANDIGPWWTTAKPLIILNATPTPDAAELDGILWILRFDESTGIEHVAKALLEIHPDPISIAPVFATRFDNHRIEFSNQGGTIVNVSYFPQWQSAETEQTLFWATPSFIWLWSQGDTCLTFR